MNEHTAFALGILLGDARRLGACLAAMSTIDRRWVWRELERMFLEWWVDEGDSVNFAVRCQLDFVPNDIEWEEICYFFDKVLDDLSGEDGE